MPDPPHENLYRALTYLREVLTKRLAAFQTADGIGGIEVDNFKLQDSDDVFTQTIVTHQANIFEFITLLLALAPHLQADFFDTILRDHFPEGSHFPAFGGVRGRHHRGILPTGETAQFVLAGNDLGQRLAVQRLFAADHWFATHRILRLEEVAEGEPLLSGRLLLDAEWLERMTTGRVSAPRFSTRFPAERLRTRLQWDDLVLPAAALRQLAEIRTWITHHPTLFGDWGMADRVRPGYRVLFHGPAGTGKTLTATLLGKMTGREVFRIDLSMVVSKFIGETEKNLANLFDKASDKGWILFFDEADALFGKRTEVRDAHDKYANQEVSYLLQRIETYAGLVILATNFRSNLDEAFTRRFETIVHFPLPKAPERLALWRKALPVKLQLAQEIDLPQIAEQYALTGANIVNIIAYCSLQLIAANRDELDADLLLAGIRREYVKEDKLI